MAHVLIPGNIWSGSRTLAVLTNPTELARKKGCLSRSWPVEFRGTRYPDSESAYKANKCSDNYSLMVEVLTCKLKQHPEIMAALAASGGVGFLERCSHVVYGKSWWEGIGIESPFIRALIEAFLSIRD